MTLATRNSLRIWPNIIEATTLPPRELMNTTLRSFLSSAPDLRKSTNACGVSDSITPSATMTCGHRAPQPPVASGWTRNVIELEFADAATEPNSDASPRTAPIAASRRSLRTMVGGDGLEPPTLSV